MIQLPPGFDASTLFSNFVSICLPFIAVASLFAGFSVLKSALNRIN